VGSFEKGIRLSANDLIRKKIEHEGEKAGRPEIVGIGE
jgi:hypothetical protein